MQQICWKALMLACSDPVPYDCMQIRDGQAQFVGVPAQDATRLTRDVIGTARFVCTPWMSLPTCRISAEKLCTCPFALKACMQQLLIRQAEFPASIDRHTINVAHQDACRQHLSSTSCNFWGPAACRYVGGTVLKVGLVLFAMSALWKLIHKLRLRNVRSRLDDPDIRAELARRSADKTYYYKYTCACF